MISQTLGEKEKNASINGTN